MIRAGIALQAVDQFGLDWNGLVAARQPIEHVHQIGGCVAGCRIVDAQFGARPVQCSTVGGGGLLRLAGVEQHGPQIGLRLQRLGMIGSKLAGIKRQRPAHDRFRCGCLVAEHQVECMVIQRPRQNETFIAQRLGQFQNPGRGFGGASIVLGLKGFGIDREITFDLGDQRIGLGLVRPWLRNLARRHVGLGGLAVRRGCYCEQCRRRNDGPALPDQWSDP